MPDIDFNYDSQLTRELGGFMINAGKSTISALYLRDQIRPIVAEQMDCLKPDGELAKHTPEQIKFLSFAPFPDSGDAALVAMRIYAFGWPDRMKDIDERLVRIVDGVRSLLELPKDTVDASFIELQHAFERQRSCWVRG